MTSKPPPVASWLHAATLLFWGVAIDHALLGGICAALRLLAPRLALRLGDAELARTADLTSLLAVALIAGLLTMAGLPRGLLLATIWLPAVLLPLTLVSAVNAEPLRLRHLALTMRRSTLPDAQLPIDLGAAHLVACLLAAGIAAKPGPWFAGALALVLLAWLASLRSRLSAGFVAAALLAAGLGYAASLGIHSAHLQVQTWVIDLLAGSAEPDPYRKQTRIGDLGELKQSQRILWRLESTPAASSPPAVPLLLRQGVYHRYASGTWLAQGDPFAPAPSVNGDVPTLRLRGSARDGSSLIPVPAATLSVSGPGAIERNPFGVFRIDRAPPQLDLGLSLGSVAEAAVATAADLALPARHTPLLPRLPELASLAARPPAERSAGLEAWFAANFRYSLYLGDDASRRRDLDAFLLRDRSGHCEYFATATVLLLRELGIPARYVSGFSVQEYSTLERAFVIRQRHAHAWAEALVDGRWIELDTTPADWAGIEDAAAPAWRHAADVLAWAKLRVGDWSRGVDWRLSLLILALGVTVLLLARFARQRPTRRLAATARSMPEALSATRRDFAALEAEFAALGLPRAPAETPRQWLRRIGRDGITVVSEARLAAAQGIVTALYRERYAGR